MVEGSAIPWLGSKNEQPYIIGYSCRRAEQIENPQGSQGSRRAECTSVNRRRRAMLHSGLRDLCGELAGGQRRLPKSRPAHPFHLSSWTVRLKGPTLLE